MLGSLEESFIGFRGECQGFQRRILGVLEGGFIEGNLKNCREGEFYNLIGQFQGHQRAVLQSYRVQFQGLSRSLEDTHRIFGGQFQDLGGQFQNLGGQFQNLREQLQDLRGQLQDLYRAVLGSYRRRLFDLGGWFQDLRLLFQCLQRAVLGSLEKSFRISKVQFQGLERIV